MYNGSEQHKENSKIALKQAAIVLANLKLKREEDYSKNPKHCLECSLPISYKKKNSTSFCNSSCAARFNNKKRGKRSETTKEKIRKASVGRVSPLKGTFRGSTKNNSAIEIPTCTVCKRLFVVQVKKGKRTEVRKTCSRECRTHASVGIRSYQNGSRKPQYYFNKWQNKDVLLDSSWEVKIAEKLDLLNIEWTRPSPIKWIDSTNKSRLYYPDFYLPKQNIYLDPKNPYCLVKDKEKLNAVAKQIQLIFGKLQDIESYIDNL